MADDLTVLVDVSETLKSILEGNIAELPPNSVVFDSPAEIQKGKAGISLFLYQILENSDLKNQEPQIIDSKTLRYPPLAVDLFYLITPYAQTRTAEQIILSKVIRTLYDNQILAGSLLRKSLVDAGNKELKILFNPVPIDHIHNIWGAFPDTPFKLSISYHVTPVYVPSTRTIETARILVKDSTFAKP